jgi:hypothetical protein
MLSVRTRANPNGKVLTLIDARKNIEKKIEFAGFESYKCYNTSNIAELT